MADFCKACSIEVWGKDTKDLANFCKDEERVAVLCETCGWIYVDKNGVKLCKGTNEKRNYFD